MKTTRAALLISLYVIATRAGAQISASGAGEEQSLDEVIVTATKTGATEIQKTPLALSVYSAAQLDTSDVNNIKDLVSMTPSFNVSQTTASAQIYIRGIGSNNVFNGSDPDVTMQSDGVYIARSFGQFADFIDVDRVEVLRGPQGTLYGRNAVGGTVNVISRLPTDEFQAKTQLTLGDYSLLQTQDYVSGPLIKGLLDASLAANFITHSAYIDNVVPGGLGVGDADHGGLRGQLRVVANEAVELITRADWSRSSEHFESSDHLLSAYAPAPLASSLVGDYTRVALNTPQINRETIWGVAEEINAKLNASLALKSITAYRYSNYDLDVDVDGTERSVIIGTQSDQSKQLSQELDLVANLPHFDGVAGLYYFTEHELSSLTSALPTPGPNFLNAVAPDAHARSEAVFAQGTYHLLNTVGITAGIRYTKESKDLDQFYDRTALANGATLPGYPFIADSSRDFHALTPKFGIDWQFLPQAMAYATATRGFKSGGTNYAASNIAALSFAPEYIWSYEAGVKTEWLQRRLRVNLAGFHYNYSDLQVQSLLGPGVTTISNAATAKVDGMELETSFKPMPSLILGANLSLLDAQYQSFNNASIPGALAPFLAGSPRRNPNGTFNASGNLLNAAPRTSASANGQYNWSVGRGTPFVRAEYYWQSRVFYDPSNALIMSQRAYSLTSVFAGYDDDIGRWGVHFFAKNLTNTHYLISITANGVEPAGLAGAPRTYGVQLTKTF